MTIDSKDAKAYLREYAHIEFDENPLDASALMDVVALIEQLEQFK